jgi:hypothetical protein
MLAVNRDMPNGHKCSMEKHWISPVSQAVTDADEALQRDKLRRKGILQDGERLTVPLMFMDAKPQAAGTIALRDAAGRPATLYDADTGAPVPLSPELIAGIEAEAKRLNLSVEFYLAEVLRYTQATSSHTGGN